MYPLNKQQPKSRPVSVAMPRAGIEPVYLLIASMLLVSTFYSRADIYTVTPNTNTQNSNFYQQLQKTTEVQYKPVYNFLFSQIAGNHPILINRQPDLIFDKDLAFNYLWMQQHQSQYQHKEGGAAAGKLVRIGAKMLYNIYSGSINDSSNSDIDITHPLSNVDYRLRLSSGKVKVGFKYQF